VGYKDKETQRSYQKEWVTERRTAWILSQGGKCVKCGNTENLEVDHIDPNTKTMNPRRLWSLSESNPIRRAELDKCQILCYSCHKEKTRLEKSKDFQHGDYGMYKRRGCRCNLCKAANAQRKREQRARKKISDGLEYLP